MTKHLPLLLVSIALFVAFQWAQGRADDYKVRWDASVEAGQLQAAKADVVTDSLVRVAVDSGAAARRYAAVADAAGKRARTIIARIDTVTVPAEAIPFTTPRDSIIFELLIESDTLRHAMRALRVANTDLRRANDLLRNTVADLGNILDDRPRPRSRLIPTLGAGVLAGVCHDLRPCSGVGITLSWRL